MEKELKVNETLDWINTSQLIRKGKSSVRSNIQELLL
jgi:hypothetical protein